MSLVKRHMMFWNIGEMLHKAGHWFQGRSFVFSGRHAFSEKSAPVKVGTRGHAEGGIFISGLSLDPADREIVKALHKGWDKSPKGEGRVKGLSKTELRKLKAGANIKWSGKNWNEGNHAEADTDGRKVTWI